MGHFDMSCPNKNGVKPQDSSKELKKPQVEEKVNHQDNDNGHVRFAEKTSRNTVLADLL